MMKVYAYIDRSHFAESVWQHAVWAARQLDAGVEVIHVIDQPVVATSHDYSGYFAVDAPDVAVEERIRLDEAQNRLLIQEGRQLLDVVTDSIRAAGVTRVSQRLFHGTVLDHLHQHAQDVALVVVGKRGEGADQDPQHLGRNIERVVRSARKPVLIAPTGFTPIRAATIAWDGGRSSGEAIHFLAHHPLLSGVSTVLLHVEDGRKSSPALVDAHRHLQATGVDVEIERRAGAVTDSILASVAEHDSHLLVIGAYGHSRIRHLVVGSTTTEILMRATIPVLVFH